MLSLQLVSTYAVAQHRLLAALVPNYTACWRRHVSADRLAQSCYLIVVHGQESNLQPLAASQTLFNHYTIKPQINISNLIKTHAAYEQ